MLDMNISNAIPKIVEAMLPRFSPKELGLYIELDLRDTYYGENEEDEKGVATMVKFIFHRPNNYTKVLVNYEFDNFSKSFVNPRMLMSFDQYSNHDSCWRSDGMHILTKHWHNINDYFGVHPGKLHSFYSFHTISYIRLLQFGKVQDADRTLGYDITFEKLSNDIVKTLLEQLEKGK